jgi:uncharacterized protein
MGILLVNIIGIVRAVSPEGTLGWYLYRLFDYTVEQRFYVIFSLLFGTGFYMFVSRAEARGENAIRLFVRRLAALLGFGVVHLFFQSGEALHVYAVIGFLLIPFYDRRPAFNFVSALAVILLSFVLGELTIVLAMFLLGLFLGQIGFFSRLDEFHPHILMTALISFILTPFALYLQYVTLTTGWYEDGANFAGLVMAALYVSLFLLLYRRRRIQQWLKPLGSFGRMALTNYLGQTAIIVLIMYLFDLKQKIGVTETTLISLGIYTVQIPISVVWLKYYEMGPLEWVWRGLTYGKWTNMKKLARTVTVPEGRSLH